MSCKRLTNGECFDAVYEVWEKYMEIEHASMTSDQLARVEDFLDDVSRLAKDD